MLSMCVCVCLCMHVCVVCACVCVCLLSICVCVLTNRVLYAEAVSNPTMRITDLRALGELRTSLYDTRWIDARVIVDATFATPYLLRPLTLPGVDIVIHSGTKYLSGHTDITAGVASFRHESDWQKCAQAMRLFGGVLPAFESFLLVRVCAIGAFLTGVEENERFTQRIECPLRVG